MTDVPDNADDTGEDWMESYDPNAEGENADAHAPSEEALAAGADTDVPPDPEQEGGDEEEGETNG